MLPFNPDPSSSSSLLLNSNSEVRLEHLKIPHSNRVTEDSLCSWSQTWERPAVWDPELRRSTDPSHSHLGPASDLWGAVLVTQSCLTLYIPMEYSLPGSSVHGILQARILEWIAIPFSRGSPWPRDWTWVSRIAGGFFTTEPPETHLLP